MDPLTIKYKHPTKTFSILKVRFDALNGPTKKKSPSNKIEGLGCAQGVGGFAATLLLNVKSLHLTSLANFCGRFLCTDSEKPFPWH